MGRKKDFYSKKSKISKNDEKPSEISSKTRSFKPEVYSMNTKKVRDPRFENICGTFERKIFDNNYKFLNKFKEKEIAFLENELLRSEIDDLEFNKITSLLTQMNNQKLEKLKARHKEKLKDEEKRYHIHELNQGRRPTYMKKSDLRLLELIHQFDDLKSKGKLQKHMKRQRKKHVCKDRTKLDIL